MTLSFKEYKQRLEQDLGEERVRSITTDWANALMRRGVIVKLEIRRWRAYTRIRPEDLGLEDEDGGYREFIAKYVSLGRKKLLPPDVIRALDRCEGRARESLLSRSFQTVWGRFVPATAYPGLKDELETLRGDYLQLRDSLIRNLVNHKEDLRQEYRVAAEQAWRRNHAGEASEEFLNTFVENILQRIPGDDYIRRSFIFDYHPFFIPLPSMLERDRTEEERLRQEREDLRVAGEHNREMLRQMQTEVGRHYLERKKELVDGFLSSVVGQMHELCQETAENVLAAIERNDNRLIGPSARQLKNLVERIRHLNFIGDEDLEQKMEEILLGLEGRAGTRQDIPQTLRELRVLSRQALGVLDRLPRGGRELQAEVISIAERHHGNRRVPLAQPVMESLHRQRRAG